jgi:hypothetical protein
LLLLIARGLAREPERRPADAIQLAVELAQLASLFPDPEGPPVFGVHLAPPSLPIPFAPPMGAPFPMHAPVMMPVHVPVPVPAPLPVPEPERAPDLAPEAEPHNAARQFRARRPSTPPPAPRSSTLPPTVDPERMEADLASLEEVAVRLERLASVDTLVDVTDHGEAAPLRRSKPTASGSAIDRELEVAWDDAASPGKARGRKQKRTHASPRPAHTRWVVVRGGVEEGPYSLDELTAMVETDRLRNADTLRPTDGPDTLLVVDVPELRALLEARLRKLEPVVSTTPKVAEPSVPLHHGHSLAGTLLLVAAIVLGFSAVGWILWARAQ